MLAFVTKDGTAHYVTIRTLACPTGPAAEMANVLLTGLVITAFVILVTLEKTANRVVMVCAAVAVGSGHMVALDMPLALPRDTSVAQVVVVNILSLDRRERPRGAPTWTCPMNNRAPVPVARQTMIASYLKSVTPMARVQMVRCKCPMELPAIANLTDPVRVEFVSNLLLQLLPVSQADHRAFLLLTPLMTQPLLSFPFIR